MVIQGGGPELRDPLLARDEEERRDAQRFRQAETGIGAQDEECRGEDIGDDGIRVHDRHRAPRRHGLPGPRVDEVAEAYAVDVDAALRLTARGDGSIGEAQLGEDPVPVLRMGHRDVGRRVPDDEDLAAQVDSGPSDL